jgi:adenine/guanine phosphoribosyltransferase-like PRPP-binding protein
MNESKKFKREDLHPERLDLPPIDRRPPYSFDSDAINLTHMLALLQRSISDRLDTVLVEMQTSPAWGPGTSLLSLRSAEVKSPFDRITGTLQFNPGIGSAEIVDFYRQPGRLSIKHGKAFTRGYRYHVGADKELNTQQKLEIISEDIADACNVIQSLRDVESIPEESYWGYLGVIDVLKHHYLSLFHAVTNPAKFNQNANMEEFAQVKDRAFLLARHFTRALYQTLLGRDHDSEIDLLELETFTRILVDYLNRQAQHNGSEMFKIAEIDHPLTIMLGVHANITNHQNIDVILALPTGGTQIGIATQLGYELYYQRSTRLHCVPLSTYSRNPTFEGLTTDAELCEYLGHLDIQEKDVLVAEDNSNTGATAQRITKALQDSGVSSSVVTIIEADVRRVVSNQRKGAGKSRAVANLLHPDYSPVGIVPIIVGNSDRSSRQIRKVVAEKIIRSSKDSSSEATVWKTVVRPGRFGNNRDKFFQAWNDEYGANNWRLAWELTDGRVLNWDEIFEQFIIAYTDYFQKHPDEAQFICDTYSYTYDRDETSYDSAFNRYALLDMPGVPNQFHHVAMNIALVEKLGYSFRGHEAIKVRAGRPGLPESEWPKGYRWQPGVIPYPYPELIITQNLGSDNWILPDSIEALYQSTKVLQIKTTFPKQK